MICHIHNSISNISNKSIGVKQEKEEIISLNDFLFGILSFLIIFVVLSWWILPLRWVCEGLYNYFDSIEFTCKDIGENK